jgi:hypothetical protein
MTVRSSGMTWPSTSILLFKGTGKGCAYFISLIKKRFTGRDATKAKLEIYTPAVRVARPLAPAAIQADISFFILATMVGTEDSCLLAKSPK